MKIVEWFGYNEESSQYLLRPGELRALVNLQPRRPGMLIARPGLSKIYGKYDDEGIYGLYRRDVLVGNQSDFLWFQKSRVSRELTIAQIAARESPWEYVWIVRRVEGYQSRVIDQIPISPNGTTSVTGFSVAEDRHGRIFIFYGHGVKPRMYRPTDLANDAFELGLAAPTTAPQVTPSGTGYFLEAVDVMSGGGSYYAPPSISVIGGDPERPARLRGIVQQGNLVGVEVLDGGANYKTFPQLKVATDKVGSGFRAIGNQAAAPAVAGFVDSSPGTVTGSAPSSQETYGSTNGFEGNKIMYLSSPITATTALVAHSGTTMTVQSVAGISVGDIVRVTPPQGSPFNSNSTTVTVTAINAAARQLTLSQSWVPTQAATTYTAQFRGPATVGYADAEYDRTTKRFTASFPLQTTKGAGEGAEATIKFTPQASSFGLGAFSMAGYVTPAGAPTPLQFAVKAVGWQNYLYDDYWQGSEFRKRNSAESATYAGLQASGAGYTIGFSGSLDNRRVDVYWPDYNAISVWSCAGTRGGDIGQWVRQDARVYTDDGYYILVELKPAANRAVTVRTARTAFASGIQRYRAAPQVTYPVVKIRLKACPDSWVYNGLDGGEFSLPTPIKEKKRDTLAWWHAGSGTARPIVDFSGSSPTLDWGTVEVVNPGAGWQRGTVFSIRVYQANPYNQRRDYNTAVRQPKMAGGHAPFSYTNRYAEFVFKATSPDVLTPDGPPAAIDGTANIDVAGSGYLANDQASLTLYKRKLTNGVAAAVQSSVITWTAEAIAAAPTGNTISSVRIISTGRNYFAPPTIQVRGGGTGYGLAVTPNIEEGRITSVNIVDPGRDYTASPELYTNTTAATAVPVMRPAMVGTYRCAYRFADRSETVVLSTEATHTQGDAPTTLTLASTAGIKADMVLEAQWLPNNTRVVSVRGNDVEMSQPVLTGETIQGAASQVQATGRLREIVIENPGTGYAQNEVVTATVSDAACVISVTLEANEDGSYSVERAEFTTLGNLQFPTGKHPVTFAAPAGGGTAATGYAIITLLRAALNRTVVVRDLTKPIAYSDFSPITDIDAGPNEERTHSSSLEWSLTGVTPPPRADIVELWRTSSDQSLVFYRLDVYGLPTPEGVTLVGDDTLTDEELFDPERANYAAMPVVLPNGSVNAYRFGQPRTDMSVCVAFQDRLWYGVSTSGKDANTLFYSEFDEFESCPDVNELPIQNNQRNTDSLTALVPFGSLLLAMQHGHCYAVTYNTDPAIDASIQMLSHRGCLHQRCWDIHDNVLYAADEAGIYAMSRTGEVTDISTPLRDFFISDTIDFDKRDTFFLQVDPRTQILRFFCVLSSAATATPNVALCYDTQRQTWWTERWPNSPTSSCTGRPTARRNNSLLVGAVDGNLYELSSDSDHCHESVTDCVVTSGGKGYKSAPKITCPNSNGVSLQAVISEGRLVDVLVHASGWGCKYGIQLLTEAGDNLATPEGNDLQGVEYAPINLEIEPPPAGGTQATAVANFSVTPRVYRYVTVAQGESFVRLLPKRFAGYEQSVTDLIEVEGPVHGGKLLEAESANPLINEKILRTEPPPVEIGMECIGDYVPLNAFVSKIIGGDIYLEHPDGTPVSILFGAARTNEPNTPATYLENGGSETFVIFRKPFRSHVPFRLATGAMALANEDNVAKGGDGLIDRSVTLLYTPTNGDKEVELIEYFNDSVTPRPNVIRRSRGGPADWDQRQDGASAVLNISTTASHLGFSNGVSKARFASRHYTDSVGEDQHVRVELFGRPEACNAFDRINFWKDAPQNRGPQPFVMHSLTVEGVVDNAE